jgi:hypothetical protein
MKELEKFLLSLEIDIRCDVVYPKVNARETMGVG